MKFEDDPLLSLSQSSYSFQIISDAYGCEKVKIFKQKSAPSYSFGSRTRYAQKEKTPAPNSYTMPNMIGMEIPSKSAPPAFSMRGRPKIGGFSEDLQKVCQTVPQHGKRPFSEFF